MFARRTKGRVHYNIRAIFHSTKNKCHVTNIYTVEEKQKYYITFSWEKNKTTILHHLPNYPEKLFTAFVILSYENRLQGNLIE